MCIQVVTVSVFTIHSFKYQSHSVRFEIIIIYNIILVFIITHLICLSHTYAQVD